MDGPRTPPSASGSGCTPDARPAPPGGYQGIAVNAGARLCSCGHGGQILVSRTVRAALGEETAVELRHLGTYRLRGIPDEHDIYQVVAKDLLDEFPALRIEA